MAGGNETTAKFRVDISDLKKNITEANRQIRLANAEFKAASSGMGDWSKSADGLSAKVTQLQSVLKSQKTILSEYEKQLELIEKEYGKDSKEADEMRIKIANQQAAVNKTERALAEYNAQLENVEKENKQAEKSTKSLGDVFKNGLAAGADAAGAALKAVIASIAAAAAAAVKFGKDSVEAGMDFDSAMSGVAATMGKTVDEIQDLRDFALDMGSKTAFSATEAADALNYMALAGYDAETSMAMLPNVLNLAAAGSIDLASASDMVTDTQTAFGISIERTTQMVDEMAKAASTGNTSVAQLGEAFLTVGGLAQELNGGIVELDDGTKKSVDGVQELEIALTAMANAGIKGSEAGTHMRNMLLKLSSPSADGALQLENLGVAVFDAEGNMRSLADVFSDLSTALGKLSQEEKMSAISDLFNSRDLASSEALLKAVNQDWDAIGSSILNAEGAASQMAETKLDNLAGDITIFKSALEGAQITLSDSLTPSLREFVQLGTDGVSRLAEAFKENGLEGAIAELNPIFEKILEKITGLRPAVIKVATELITAIAEQLPPILQSILPPLIQGVSQVLHALVHQAPTLLQIVSDSLPMLLDALLSILPEVVQVGLQIISQLAIGISKALPTLIPQVISVVLSIVDCLIDNIDILIDGATQLIIGFTKGLIDAIPILLEKAPVILEKFINSLLDNWPVIMDMAIQLTEMFVKAIIENLPLLFDAAKQIIISLGDGLLKLTKAINEKTKLLFAGIKKNWNESMSWIKAGLSNAQKFVGNLIGKIGETVKAKVSAILEGIKEIVSNAMQAIKDYFQPVINFYSAAWNIIKELAEGCWKLIQKVWETVSEWFDKNIITPVRRIFEGLWSGIRTAASDAWTVIKSVWTAVSTWFSNTVIKPVTDFFSGMWDKLKKGASDAWEGIKTVFSHVSDWFKDTFSTAWQKVKDVFSTGGKVFDGIKEGIVESFKTVVNAIIRGINKVIAVPFNAINGILDDIQNIEVAGIYPFDGIVHRLPVPEIPELERGGVLRRGQLGLLEGNGAEAVVPLEKNSKWIAAVTADLKKSLASEGVISAAGGKSSQTVNNYFTQNNNSPKALSRLEIYRQSKNLLRMKGGA